MQNMNTEAAMSHYILEQSEHQRDHDSLAYELLLQRLVREGDVEGIERMLSGGEFDPDHMGRMARRPQKQQEYICVVLITLISRAAAEGGMDREAAYSLADVFLQRLESCRAEGEILALNIQAQREFTARVRMAREARSRLSYIEACKAYITANLCRPFQVGDIAPAIGVNRSYLARRFSEAEGMTIQRYISRERYAHAAGLLKFSDYPISIIAEYFCFSSQSHFGRAFKAWCGMTPREYRNIHKDPQQQTPVPKK